MFFSELFGITTGTQPEVKGRDGLWQQHLRRLRMGVCAEVFSSRDDLLATSDIAEAVREMGWTVRFVAGCYLDPQPLSADATSVHIIGWRSDALDGDWVDELIQGSRREEIERLAEEGKLALLDFKAVPGFADQAQDADDVAVLAREAGQAVADLVYGARTAYCIENHCLMLTLCVELQSAMQEAIWRETEGLMEDGQLEWRLWGRDLPPPPDPQPEPASRKRWSDVLFQGAPIIGQTIALVDGIVALYRARRADLEFVEEVEFAREYFPDLEIPLRHESFIREVAERATAFVGSIVGCVLLAVVAWPTGSFRLIYLSSWGGGLLGGLLGGHAAQAVLDAREARQADSVPRLLVDDEETEGTRAP